MLSAGRKVRGRHPSSPEKNAPPRCCVCALRVQHPVYCTIPMIQQSWHMEAAVSARILVVDDMPSIRHSMRLCLEQEAGWVICGEAENGKTAIDRVQELRPDLVIIDLSMPVMNMPPAQLKRLLPALTSSCLPCTPTPICWTRPERWELIKYFPSRTQGARNCSRPSAP